MLEEDAGGRGIYGPYESALAKLRYLTRWGADKSSFGKSGNAIQYDSIG